MSGLPADTGPSGHRQRLRERFLERGSTALADYEILEMLLFAAKTRGDTKPLAKALIREFGSLGGVLNASTEQLQKVPYMGTSGAATVKVVTEAAQRLAREEAHERTVISSWDKLLTYCHLQLAHEKVENFHLLFLDRKNKLIADERQQHGTVDHTPVYPREVVKRALELGASALILVHNHPSGDPTPSQADIEMTKQIRTAAGHLGIEIHDHIIIGRQGHSSFRSLGLL
ncbi:MAG: RadC family protein [Pseudomonadota bacterium]